MSYMRFQIDLAVKEPIPQELKDVLPKIKEGIQKLKSFASNDKMLLTATWHICKHDEGLPCEAEQEI